MRQVLNDSELSFLSGQMAMILHSGISVLEGFTILKEDSPAGEGQEILGEVCDSLEQTGDLTEALKSTGCFPDYFVKMTEIGDRSGELEDVMRSLSSYYERQHTLVGSIRDALTWPLILLAMLFAVLAVLMTQVMPVFEEVFEQLGMEVSGVTSVVFRMGSFMQRASAFILIVFVAFVILVLVSLKTPRLRVSLLSILNHLPFMREVSDLLTCSRFSHTLSLALHSGLDMGEGLNLAAGLVEDPAAREKLEKASRAMDEGIDFGEALRESGVFSGLNARMASIGFRTGSAETALEEISLRCQDEADARLQSAVGALEPAITAVLSILTGLILVSVMLPLLGVMTSIG
ncbi:MAG: type II secretion system F family protein [Lachnospiraceae bacterium]|nr:type II secretion system F family protein [Lachnospiraceae bacterium]MCD7841647.1 type II secretion system F family protein [Lachnospiraceae bacterium]